MDGHIEESYEKCGVSVKESEKRAWATVNKVTEGGKKAFRVGAMGDCANFYFMPLFFRLR
jgi:hypothetical protein